MVKNIAKHVWDHYLLYYFIFLNVNEGKFVINLNLRNFRILKSWGYFVVLDQF